MGDISGAVLCLVSVSYVTAFRCLSILTEILKQIQNGFKKIKKAAQEAELVPFLLPNLRRNSNPNIKSYILELFHSSL